MKSQELFNKKLWLAPLAGYTDHVYRIICKRYGADVLVSEMISADALIHRNKKTAILAEFYADERPIGLQVFGNSAEKIAKGIELLKQYKPDFFDINMGCPIKKVVKNGSGSALLKEPKKVAAIVRKVRKTHPEIVFTVKIRTGWNSDKHFDDIVTLIEQEGASGLILHPRTRSQLFSGKSDWNYIARAKELVKIPVVGNGDILTPEDGIRMYSETGCDSIMIGRGAIGNPLIFGQIKQRLAQPTQNVNSFLHPISIMKGHFKDLVEFHGESNGIKLFRKFVPYYTKGLFGATHLREAINHLTSKYEIIDVIEEFEQSVVNG
ncbi:MAG TPA: tRNA dihydrouridine synthase DusB [Candidatus Cloacimonetes bacterium]|nr:tRNA dihydrouridine synthase DusB [Candidatus Cloacimonadota bacterium]HEX38159.1 tRNA dihydrouridine synthase DusB [Candidatus Cloacimonadota bacterium]